MSRYAQHAERRFHCLDWYNNKLCWKFYYSLSYMIILYFGTLYHMVILIRVRMKEKIVHIHEKAFKSIGPG